MSKKHTLSATVSVNRAEVLQALSTRADISDLRPDKACKVS